MKKFIMLFLLLSFMPASFGATEASRFVEKQYISEYKLYNIHITVKKEHTADYYQLLADNTVKAITYGYGDMKIMGYKKFSISYICLLDENNKPFWGYVVPTE